MNDTKSPTPWFSYYGQQPKGQTRVFAFPYSGTGASVFHQWSQGLQDSPHDFIGVQLPGRENRIHEPAYTDLTLLLQNLLPAIRPLLDKPYVFFGHSLGALIAFELCRVLRKNSLPLPQNLFISAFRSPERPNPNKALHQLPLPAFISELREYANTPEEILSNQEMMEFFLPLLRGDFSVHETYRYQHESPLSCAITVLSADDDKIVDSRSMRNWRQQTTGNFSHVTYTGGHFFLHRYRAEIICQLRASLA